MAEKGMSNADFAARRAKGRLRAEDLQANAEAIGDDQAWFEQLYTEADGDEALVPWVDQEPNPGLTHWIGMSGFLHEGRALDVGCGLGDNAEALSDAGYDVTAFDLSVTAVNWAKSRFSGTRVDYCQADLFDLPKDWHGKFDLVHETYTLQALQGELRQKAMEALVPLIKPGGLLLVICRSRVEGAQPNGPPWPLAKSELDRFRALGLRQTEFKAFDITEEDVVPHFRAQYRA